MRRQFLALSVACALLVACDTVTPVAQFWRPISEPNLLMETVSLQQKLEFDLRQCHCGIYPTNATRDDMVKMQYDKQRYAQTGVTIIPDETTGTCQQTPSLVVTECMRQRGWEPTNCSGRMPMPEGGSMCASYHPSDDE